MQLIGNVTLNASSVDCKLDGTSCIGLTLSGSAILTPIGMGFFVSILQHHL